MIPRLALPAACALVLLCTSPPTHAEGDAERATARGLAQQGLALKKQGNCKEALGPLQQAQAIYDAPTHLLAIAQCQTQLGQLVEAAETYRKLGRAELTPKSPAIFRTAQQTGEKELAELAPRIATLILDITPPSVPGVVLRLDGEPLLLQMLGAARPANPGEHRFEVEAPGFERAQKTITLKEGEKQRMVLPLRKMESSLPAPTASASAPVAPPPSAPLASAPPLPPPPESGTGWRTAGYVAGGAGLVAIALGSYFGLKAIGSKSDLLNTCKAPTCSNDTFESRKKDEVSGKALASSVFFGVGVVGLGLGTVLILTTPNSPSPTTSLHLGPGSIHLAGSFLCARSPSLLACSRSPFWRAAAASSVSTI
jgi:hypothetical protein